MHETLTQDRLYVSVDALALTVREGRLNLLLSRRTAPPFKGCWALPGRLVGLEESAEAAVERLAAEMLPARCGYMEQLYTFSALNRDPRGRVISVAYLVPLPWGRLREALEAGDGPMRRFEAALEPTGLTLTGEDGLRLTGGDLAFDHGRVIETGVLRLRGKIDYSDLAFRFLNDPACFSLGELQQVFEAALGHGLDASNFRRAILGRYEPGGRLQPLDRMESTGRGRRGRPAAMYRFNDFEKG